MLSSTDSKSEEILRQTLREAYERYQAATARYRTLLEDEQAGETRYLDPPLVIARGAESEALAEYMRILRILSGLTSGDNTR